MEKTTDHFRRIARLPDNISDDAIMEALFPDGILADISNIEAVKILVKAFKPVNQMPSEKLYATDNDAAQIKTNMPQNSEVPPLILDENSVTVSSESINIDTTGKVDNEAVEPIGYFATDLNVSGLISDLDYINKEITEKAAAAIGMPVKTFAADNAAVLQALTQMEQQIARMVETHLTTPEAIAVSRLTHMQNVTSLVKRATTLENALLFLGEEFGIKLPTSRVDLTNMTVDAIEVPVTVNSVFTYDQILQLTVLLGQRGKQIKNLKRQIVDHQKAIHQLTEQIISPVVHTPITEKSDEVRIGRNEYYIIRDHKSKLYSLTLLAVEASEMHEAKFVEYSADCIDNGTPFLSIDDAAKYLTGLYKTKQLPKRGNYFIVKVSKVLADNDEIEDEIHNELNVARQGFESWVKEIINAKASIAEVSEKPRRDKKRNKKHRRRDQT